MPSNASQWQAQLQAAATVDIKSLPSDVQKLSSVDPEFRQAMLHEFEEVKEELRANFTEVFTLISVESEKTRLHVSMEHDKTRDTIQELRQTVLDLSAQFEGGSAKNRDECVRVDDIDVRASDSFPGNRNFDISAGGTHVTLCLVGKNNAAFLDDMRKEVKVGSVLRRPTLGLYTRVASDDECFAHTITQNSLLRTCWWISKYEACQCFTGMRKTVGIFTLAESAMLTLIGWCARGRRTFRSHLQVRTRFASCAFCLSLLM